MDIPIQDRPDPVDLGDVYFYVVSENNLEEFIDNINDIEGELVFFAITVDDYETLSFNVAELRRYIEQQKGLILYYEDSIQINKE